jgi:hypothetical protein
MSTLLVIRLVIQTLDHRLQTHQTEEEIAKTVQGKRRSSEQTHWSLDVISYISKSLVSEVQSPVSELQ